MSISTYLANTLAVVYSGIYVGNDVEILFDNMTAAEREDAHKNWLTFNDTYMLDIPPEMTSITKYRASLGHKVTT